MCFDSDLQPQRSRKKNPLQREPNRNIPVNPISPNAVIRCALSATFRPVSTTRSHSGISAALAAARAALKRATFWRGVSSRGVGAESEGDEGKRLLEEEEEEEEVSENGFLKSRGLGEGVLEGEERQGGD